MIKSSTVRGVLVHSSSPFASVVKPSWRSCSSSLLAASNPKTHRFVPSLITTRSPSFRSFSNTHSLLGRQQIPLLATTTSTSLPLSPLARFSSSTTASKPNATKPRSLFMKTNTTERLAKLRALMRQHEIQAYIIPTADAHQSEYIASCDSRREFISGFTGSAGTAVVLDVPSKDKKEQAMLWTDGRYFLQASQELDDNWQLMKDYQPGTPSIQQALGENLPQNSKVGVDARLVTESRWNTWSEHLTPLGISIVPIDVNLVDAVWADSRPAEPKGKVIFLEEKYSGSSTKEKLSNVRTKLSELGAKALVLSALDEIAWTLNIRGSDIPFNPVVKSFLLITESNATLYIDEEKLKTSNQSEELTRHFKENSVQIKSYDQVYQDVGECDDILLDDAHHSRALFEAARKNEKNIVTGTNPVVLAKALKNPTEVEGFRQCHIRDGAALSKYFAWLQEELTVKNNTSLNEVSSSDKLEEFRSQMDLFMGLSFATISGSGANGAIIHYHAHKDTAAPLSIDLLYLCDSGGQYKDGTTDVTRTLHFGTPSDHQKKCYTRVLQGHIALALARFPEGTFGHQLDVLARTPLWQDGLNYRHGTGHGVGHFLNVHEGPQGIGTRQTTVPLQPSMTVTNEPGYYEDGQFGIRIENVMVVREAKTPFNFGDTRYFEFETVTMTPYQKKLIDTSLLSPREIEYVNSYHQEVYEKLSPLLKGDQRTLDWVYNETRPL